MLSNRGEVLTKFNMGRLVCSEQIKYLCKQKRTMNKKIATITIDLYQEGLLARCEDIEAEALCFTGNQVMDFLNEVKESCDPDATYTLTDKGRELLDTLQKACEEEIDNLTM